METFLPRLRPLTVPQMVDEGLKLYRRNFGTFFGILLISGAILFVTQLVLTYVAAAAFEDVVVEESSFQRGPGYTHERVFFVQLGPNRIILTRETAGLAAMLGIAWMIVVALAWVFSIGALTVAVSKRYLGERITIAGAYRAVGRLFWRLVGTGFLYVLKLVFYTVLLFALGIGLAIIAHEPVIGALTIIPWIVLLVYYLISYLLFTQVVVIEGRSGLNALRRSKWLVRSRDPMTRKSNASRVFGLIILVTLIVFAVSLVATIPAGIVLGVRQHQEIARQDRPFEPPQGKDVLVNLINAVFELLIGPIWTTAFILLYYDIRIRREGFDLQMMAQALAAQSAAGPPR